MKLWGVKTLAEARALDSNTIFQKGNEFRSTYMWGSVVDGTLIPDYPSNIMLENKRNNVEIINGNTVDEFPVKPKASTIEELEEYARKTFGKYSDNYLEICKKGANNLEEMINNGTYNRFQIGNLLWGDLNSKLKASKMYYYNFNPEIPGPDHPGSFHSSDLWFAFETLAKCWRPFVGKHYDLARQICNYWTNFAKTGNPNGNDADGTPMPEWTEYTAETPYPIYFGDKAEMDKSPRTELENFLVEFFTEKLENRDMKNFYEM